MWQYQNTDELYHYGVLGMKWGHRKNNKDSSLTSTRKTRYQKVSRKEYNKEYNSLKKQYIQKDPRIKQAENIRKEAIRYGTKHKLDMDDGGGGSKKAGQKYMAMWDKYEKINDTIYKDAITKTHNQLKNKYGEKRIKQIGRQNTALGLATLGGVAIGTAVTVDLAKHGAKMAGRAIKKTAKYAYNIVKGDK